MCPAPAILQQYLQKVSMKQGVFHSIIIISSEIVGVVFALHILRHLVTYDVAERGTRYGLKFSFAELRPNYSGQFGSIMLCYSAELQYYSASFFCHVQRQGQGQGLENWSSRILEDKDFPGGQQH